MIPFELAPDASDRSRFVVFGRLLRRAGFVAVVDPRRDAHLPAPLLVVLSDELMDGAVFFSPLLASAPRTRAAGAAEPCSPVR